jgi:hypothetical protein
MIRRVGFLKCFQVATHALGGKSLAIELTDSPGLVTGVAIRHSMRTDERETILMRVDVLKRNLPPAHAVARIALGPVLPAMQVGVTILAIAAHLRKHWIEVALLAGNTRVQALQGIAGLVVIKLGFTAEGLPGGGRVAFLARNLHRPVRAGLGRG